MSAKDKIEMKRDEKATTFTVRIEGIQMPEELCKEVNDEIQAVIHRAMGKIDYGANPSWRATANSVTWVRPIPGPWPFGIYVKRFGIDDLRQDLKGTVLKDSGILLETEELGKMGFGH